MNYNKFGQESNEKDKVFAKTIDGKIKKIYYVLTYNNLVYDPLGPDSNREANLNTVLKPTSKQTFDYYMKYLQSNNRLYITKAQRSYING